VNGTTYRWTAVILGVALLAAAAGYYLARHGSAPAGGERQVTYWYDPMHPEQHFDRPGKSPFMDMQLLPRYADAGAGADAGGGQSTAVRIDPGVAQNLGVRYATVERGPWTQGLDAVGSIVFDQRRVAVVQARTGGFVTGVHARAPGDVVARGAPLVDLLVPEWAGAQAEFIALLKGGDHALIDAARTRLTLLGMSEELIARVETERRVQTTVTIRAPIGGAIESLDVRDGMTVSAGATLVKINGIGTVWLEIAVPEAQGALATVGRSVEAQLTAWPAEIFRGRVLAVLPEANAETRTLRVRVELPNRDGRLKPGMFAQVRLETGGQQSVLQVASEAIIRTGTRNVVLVAGDNGRYTPTEVRLGPEASGRTVIVEGLDEGQKVVASGQFLIDSEANLAGVLARLQTGAASLHAATGKVESVAPGELMVSHGPIPSLRLPAMTMAFKLARPDLAAQLREGDTITFRFRQAGDDFVIEELHKSEDAR
jgi:membrane fusion protein, copper/silver efflux system